MLNQDNGSSGQGNPGEQPRRPRRRAAGTKTLLGLNEYMLGQMDDLDDKVLGNKTSLSKTRWARVILDSTKAVQKFGVDVNGSKDVDIVPADQRDDIDLQIIAQAEKDLEEQTRLQQQQQEELTQRKQAILARRNSQKG